MASPFPRPRRKSTVRSAGRAEESIILENARELANDPARAVPVCVGSCVWFCPFDSARKEVERAHEARDDEAKLQKLAKKGGTIGRAYAATILLAKQGKLSYVANFKSPIGTYAYAVRGSAKPIALVGMQHHDDPQIRLLSVAEAVRKRGLHVYAVGDGMVSSGRKPGAPREFAEQEFERLDLSDSGKPSAAGGPRFTCPHPSDRPALVLRIASARAEGRMCAACAKESNSLRGIMGHMAAPKPARDFDVEVELPEIAGMKEPPKADLALRENYIKGALTDKEFIRRTEAARREALRAAGKRLLVAGGTTYDTPEAFVDALSPTPVERVALLKALEVWDRPLVLERASVALALGEVWKDRGKSAVEAAAGGDAEVANRLYSASAPASDLLGILVRAEREGKRHRLEDALPRFKALPPALAFADRAARLHRLAGREETLRLAEAETQSKGMALAFLLALEGAGGKAWRFSQSDQDFARDLKPLVERLIKSDAKEYANALSDLGVAAALGPVSPE